MCRCVQVLWQRYMHGMLSSGFSATTPLYVASGVLSYAPSGG
jgi:hypothetical protein